METNIELEMLNGKIISPLSLYQPDEAIKELTLETRKDLIRGDMILSRPFREFNNYSLIQRASLDQQDWLAWSPEPSSNPDEAWMFTGTSNATRNNIISMAAHVAQKIIYPGVSAQNDSQQDDKDAAYVARGLLEYNFRQSDYASTFLYAVISGMVNPVTYYKADYCKAYMSILEGTNDKFVRKQVVDDAMSGFQHYLLPADEVLISNPYCFDLHKQKVLIHRRRISYSEAKSYFGNHPNWVHVNIGIMPAYNAGDALFYNTRDPIQDQMVEVCTYKYRSIDMEFDEVNRIYMGNSNVSYNPFKHRTNKNQPAYNIAKFGAEPIDAKRFWAYKSIAAKLSNDKELLDRMRQNAVDASTLSTYPPMFTMGAGKMDQSVYRPATVTNIDKDAKAQPVNNTNAVAAWNAVQQVQKDIDSASNPSYFSLPSGGGGKKTALEIQMLQQNALVNLVVISTMVGSMVRDIGHIVLHDALRYQTIGEIGQIVNGIPSLTYKSYNIPKVKNGKSVTDRIIFTDTYAGTKMTQEEKDLASVALIEKHGDDAHVWEVNPSVFLNLDFFVSIDADELFQKDSLSIQKMKQEVYDKAITNPLIVNDMKVLADITRDFLFEPIVHGEASKYIPDQSTKNVMGSVTPQQPNGSNSAIPSSNIAKKATAMLK